MEEMLRRHIEEVVPLSDDEYDFVRQHFTTRNFKKGELLIEKNKMVRHVYLVISGLLKLVYYDEADREHIISFALEEWWESDYPAWFSGQPATLSLQCIEATEVYCLTLEKLQCHLRGFSVIKQAGYECGNIVRLTVYTTSSDEFINKCFDIFRSFVAKHGMKQAVTLMQVVALNETLNVELEATVVR